MAMFRKCLKDYSLKLDSDDALSEIVEQEEMEGTFDNYVDNVIVIDESDSDYEDNNDDNEDDVSAIDEFVNEGKKMD